MITGIIAAVRTGFLLPESLLHTSWFCVVAASVAIYTVIYVVLGLIKITPKIRIKRRSQVSRRSETRSIYPDAAV